MGTEKAIERLKRGLENTLFSTLYSQEQQDEDIKILLKELEQEKMKNKEIKNEIAYLQKIEPEKLKIIADSWHENIAKN